MVFYEHISGEVLKLGIVIALLIQRHMMTF